MPTAEYIRLIPDRGKEIEPVGRWSTFDRHTLKFYFTSCLIVRTGWNFIDACASKYAPALVLELGYQLELLPASLVMFLFVLLSAKAENNSGRLKLYIALSGRHPLTLQILSKQCEILLTVLPVSNNVSSHFYLSWIGLYLYFLWLQSEVCGRLENHERIGLQVRQFLWSYLHSCHLARYFTRTA